MKYYKTTCKECDNPCRTSYSGKVKDCICRKCIMLKTPVIVCPNCKVRRDVKQHTYRVAEDVGTDNLRIRSKLCQSCSVLAPNKKMAGFMHTCIDCKRTIKVVSQERANGLRCMECYGKVRPKRGKAKKLGVEKQYSESMYQLDRDLLAGKLL